MCTYAPLWLSHGWLCHTSRSWLVDHRSRQVNLSVSRTTTRANSLIGLMTIDRGAQACEWKLSLGQNCLIRLSQAVLLVCPNRDTYRIIELAADYEVQGQDMGVCGGDRALQGGP